MRTQRDRQVQGAETRERALKGDDGEAGREARLRVTLFDADGEDRAIEADAIDPSTLSERQLLWIDVEDDGGADADALLMQLAQQLGLGDAAAQLLNDLSGDTRLQNVGDWFLAQVVAVEHAGKLRFEGRGLAIVCGPNFVVSLHRGPLEFIEQLRDREHADTRIGSLSAESFTASLLGWVVESYLHAVSDFEAAVDRLEVTVLASKVHRECLPELAQLRRGASRLRRMLAPHRHVFGALARPDFRPDVEGVVDKHFRALEQRFERAMDAVENTRDLVVGSFELFTTRTAQRTNDTMRVLTFFTALLGSLAVIAGVLGMNFTVAFFSSGAQGFWITIGSMIAIVVLATAFARWRRWF
jgi:magnesium transporter